MMNRRGLARFVLLAGALMVSTLLARHWPKDQTVHYILGRGAPQVEELDARWASGDPAKGSPGAPDVRADEDWTAQASFRYAAGQAPRVVTHELRLADGEYTVQIEIVTSSPPEGRPIEPIRRRVALRGGVTSIDLAPLLAGGDHAAEAAAWRAVRP
jgi:hypothetical protein